MIGILTKLIKTIAMLKNILKLEGAQELTRSEQKTISGGKIQCKVNGVCTQYGLQCAEAVCRLIPDFEL
jgi:hypothetical protein